MNQRNKLIKAYQIVCKILLDDLDETYPLEESTTIRMYRIKNLLIDYLEGTDEQPTNHEG